MQDVHVGAAAQADAGLRLRWDAKPLRWPGRAALFVGFVLLVCLRMPTIVLHGRLWAEEGYFYHSALALPWWQALFAGYGGYLNLVANAAGVLAWHLVPLPDAPWVMTGIGLLFQISPAILILTSRATWLRSPWAVLAALLILATPALAEEVWLQSLHSQFQLALCAALVLSFDDLADVGPFVRWLRLALVFLAPLCGMGAVILMPFFVLRALFDRSRARIAQAGALLLGTVLQVGLFYSAGSGAALGRAFTVWSSVIVDAFFIRHVLTPFLGIWETMQLAPGIKASLQAGHPPVVPALVTAALLLAAGLPALRIWRQAALWLLVPAVVIAVVSYYGAIDGGLNLLNVRSHERYNFMPQVLIGWSLVALAATHPARAVARIAVIAVVWIIALDLVEYPLSAHTQFAFGPDWQAEVRQWQSDPSHVIQLWPAGWTLPISPDIIPKPP